MAAAFHGVTRTRAGCASARGSRLEEPFHAPFNPPPFRLPCHLCSCSRDVRPATRAPAGCPSRLWLCLRVRPVGRWNPDELAFRPRGQAGLPRFVGSPAHATCARFARNGWGFPCRLFGSGAIVRCRWAVARAVTGGVGALRALASSRPRTAITRRPRPERLGRWGLSGPVRDTGVAGPGWMKAMPDASFGRGSRKGCARAELSPLPAWLPTRPATSSYRGKN